MALINNLGIVYHQYCSSSEKASLCFLFKGKIILETDTPKMLKLNDKDQIDCILAAAVAEGGMG